ncbi:PAS domain S-box protein [[Clostridium] dakarense]|uniref:PAS domain S-box protein n=1 Tax=Faecalimicrobium dakarense TaxID=1301100 RepID=UPI0004B7E05B|nr:PAS domain S-box protein [[Clostridium] dakarense]
MRLFFNKLDEHILVMNNDGDIKFCNDKLLLKLQYEEKEISNINISNILFGQNNSITELLKYKNKGKIDLNLYSKSNKIISMSCKIIEDIYNNESLIFVIGKEICEKCYSIKDLEILLDKSPFTAWIKDVNGKYLYVNKAYEESLLKSKSEILGKYDKDIWCLENATKYIKIDKEIINSKRAKSYEEKFTCNGKEEWFEKFKYPVADENGNLKYILGVGKSITAEKNLKDKIADNYSEIATLNNLINSDKEIDLYGLLEKICKNVLEHIESDGISIMLYNSDKEILEPKVKIDYANKVIPRDCFINLPRHKALEIVEKNYNEGIKSINEVENLIVIDSSAEQDIEYIGTYNISLNNELIGMLNFSYKKGNTPKHDLDSDIKIICMQIAVIIKNFKLSQEVKIEFEKRKETENKLEVFLETAADIVGIIDCKGNIKKVSMSWTKILGWSSEELLSMNWNEIIHPEDKESFDDIWIELKNNKSTMRGQRRYLCKNGEYRWLYVNVMYLEDENEYAMAARDITEEKKIKEEKKALQEAVELESVKNEFFANISHEFKTPINIILGTMQLLKKKVNQGSIYCNDDTNLLNYINSIKQNSYRLLRLVNNLIDMTRIDTGYYEINLKNYDIVKIVEDITMSVTQYVENKGIDIVFDTNVEESIIACDPDKIERIMLNILSNAIKYTDKNGEIMVDLNQVNEKVTVSIKDNGVGISEEKLDFIFERFGQASNALTRKCEGSGIGLSLVKSLVNMHGGEIYVKSSKGEGTEFIFEIPIKIVDKKNENINNNDYEELRIEKCNIEFSDIYS